MNYIVPGIAALGGASLAMSFMRQQDQTQPSSGEAQKEMEQAQRQVAIERKKREEDSKKHKNEINDLKRSHEAELATLRHTQVISWLDHITNILSSVVHTNDQVSPGRIDAEGPNPEDRESC